MTERRRFRLLPPDSYLGWTPYAWLIYVAAFLVEPVLRTSAGEAGVGVWVATGVGLAIFFPAYFRAYWERGNRQIAVIAVHVALGVVFAPFNGGSYVFPIYAAAFSAYVEPPRRALYVLGAVTLAMAGTLLVFDVPLYIWLGATTFAPILGGVNLHFAQARKADAQLRMAQEEIRHLAAVAERERIARDMHDVLGHTLSLIVLKSELAVKLAERDPSRAVDEMRDVERVSRNALRDVRRAIGGYRTSLDEEVVRARSLLDAAGIRPDVDADIDVSAGRPDGREAVIALALREAVTNVVRHASASSCRVRITAAPSPSGSSGGGDGEWRLEVVDDGRGIDGAGSGREPALNGRGADGGGGLRGMRERVASLGGAVEVERVSPRGGTRLRIALPAAGGARPEAPVSAAEEEALP